MANMDITYEDMTSAANDLRTGQEDLGTVLTNLSALISNLVETGFVTDAASGAYQEQYENFTTGTTEAISALENLAGFLEQAAQVLSSTDTDLENAARGLPILIPGRGARRSSSERNPRVHHPSVLVRASNDVLQHVLARYRRRQGRRAG